MDLKLKRVVMEVFGGCNYTCQMCPQSNPGRGSNFTRKMKLTEFNRILDEIVPKYGHPQINLEGSGEPTMAKDLPEYIKSVKKRNLKCFMYCNGARVNGQFMRDVIVGKVDDHTAICSMDVFDPEKMQAMFEDPEMKKIEEEMGLVHEVYQLQPMQG